MTDSIDPRTERFTDNMPHDSKAAYDTRQEYDLAKEAMAAADCKKLFMLYERALKQRNDLLGGIVVLASEGFGDGVRNMRKEPEPSVPADVAALKEVAMAAVALAQSVIASRSAP